MSFSSDKSKRPEQFQAELNPSEEIYRNLFDNNPMPMWIYETNSLRFLEVNKAAVKQYGYTREEFLQMSILDIRSSSDQSRLEELAQKLDNSNLRFSGEWTHLKKNGDPIQVEVKSHFIEFRGKPSSLVLINDISEKIKAQKQEDFQRKDKLALINTTEDLIWSINKNLDLTAANNAYIERIKKTVNRDIRPGDKVLKEDMDEGGYSVKWLEIYNRGLAGESFYDEIKVPGNISRGVETTWLGITCNPIYENDTISGLACYARDISKAKAYERELESINNRLENALDISRLGYWEIDETKSRMFWSRQVYELLGISGNQPEADYQVYLQAIHEDDRQVFEDAIQRSFLKKDTLELTYRIIDKSGDIKFINQKGAVVHKESYDLPVLECLIQDITESKRAEQALLESEQKYRSIFDLSPLPQWIYSIASFRILDVNQAAINHYGYSRTEFLNMTVKELRPEGEIAKLLEAVKMKPSPGTVSYGQWKHRKKDGTEIDVEISGHKIDYNGIASLLIVSNDITERIKKDTELILINQRLETAQRIAHLGYWQHDFIKDESFWSNQMYQIFDLDKGEVIAGFKAALSRIPESEHDMFTDIVERAKENDGVFEIQHHIITRKGERKTVVGKGNYSFNENGDVVLGSGTVQDITEINIIEEKLESNQKQLELIYNNVTDSIFLLSIEKERFRFKSVNYAFLETTGLKEEDVVGLYVEQVIPEPSLTLVLEKYNEAIRNKKSVQWEEVTPYPTGIKYGIVSITPIFDESGACTMLLGSVHDITATREAAAELLEMNERFLHASKATSDAIWDWDLKTNSLLWGESYEQLTGFAVKANNISISSWTNRIHPEDRDRVTESIYEVINSTENNWQSEYRYLHFNGSYIFIADRGIVLRDAEGNPYRMIGAMQDISHLKETEIILKELNQNLARRAAELAESNEELERFAYIASHDLQEPLRMVTSFLQLLVHKYKGQLDAEASRYIHFAVDGANRMKDLINDLLEYSRLDTRSELEETTDMNEIMREINRNVKLVREKRVELQWEVLPVVEKSSRTQLYQLMQNLVNNAIKYNNKEIAKVSISSSENESEYILKVEDNGIGIDSRFFDKVFIIFQRLHNQSEYSGTGIGLSICKKIAERHGGRIWIESVKGKGSVFYFSLSKKTVI